MSKPIVYDLYCGLGGWAEGFLAEGYRVVGYDIEAHDYGTGGYPGELILRDVRSITGEECKDAAVIVASPPCQAYSYRAMPWKRAKALPPPDNTLFNECFRIQREANEANRVANWDHPYLKRGQCLDCEGTGNFYGNDEDGDYLPCDTCGGWSQSLKRHYIPLIVENVRGAQKWVGRAQWHCGSFFLWGDVPALMPIFKKIKAPGMNWSDQTKRGQDFTRLAGQYALKVGNASTRTFSERRDLAEVHPELDPHNFWHNSREDSGVKQSGISGVRENGKGDKWFQDGAARHGSRSRSRKAASAMIAKIPFPLAQHIAQCFKPVES